MKSQDVYGEPIIFQRSNGIDRVYRPILTDEERARRMKRIEQAAAALILAAEEAKRKHGGADDRKNDPVKP